MSLLFIDGFDHYAIGDISKKWTNIGSGSGGSLLIESTYQRRSGTSYLNFYTSSPSDLPPTIEKSFENTDSTIILGYALRDRDTNYVSTVYFIDDTTTQCYLKFDGNSGSGSDLGVYLYDSGDSLLDSNVTSGDINDTWIYIEIKLTIGNSGSYEVRVNGIDALSGSGVDIQSSANAYANKVKFNYVVNKLIDDLYILNGAGTSNNDFLGDCKIECIYPEGDYGTQEFTPSTGTEHFALVDETDPDDDSTYVYANLTDIKDRFTFGDDILSDGQIFGVQHNMLARKLTVGLALGLKALVNRGGTDYVLTQKFPESSYKFLTPIWEEDPYTTSQWLKANVNNIIAGFKMGTSS